jgi:predicted ATPase
MGHPDQARRTADEASRYAAELGHANTTAHVLCHAMCERAQFQRDVSSTRGYAEAMLSLAAEHDMPMWRGYGLVFRGWVLAEEGEAQDGASLVRQGIREMDALGTVFHRTHHLGLLARIEARLGHPAAGLRVLEEAYDEVARTEVRLFESELRRIEGALQLLAGRPEEAERCYAVATKVARGQEARAFELRVACDLARLWRNQRRHAEAREFLAPVYGAFTEGLTLPDLVEARALLEEQGEPNTGVPIQPSRPERVVMPR